jgi:uncharacterized protein (UPF0548 family)
VSKESGAESAGSAGSGVQRSCNLWRGAEEVSKSKSEWECDGGDRSSGVKVTGRRNTVVQLVLLVVLVVLVVVVTVRKVKSISRIE